MLQPRNHESDKNQHAKLMWMCICMTRIIPYQEEITIFGLKLFSNIDFNLFPKDFKKQNQLFNLWFNTLYRAFSKSNKQNTITSRFTTVCFQIISVLSSNPCWKIASTVVAEIWNLLASSTMNLSYYLGVEIWIYSSAVRKLIWHVLDYCAWWKAVKRGRKMWNMCIGNWF